MTTSSTSNRDLILRTLRLSSQPLDDDELARRAGIHPRQTVNQICRAMERAGVLRRFTGRDGKLVNTLTEATTSVPQDQAAGIGANEGMERADRLTGESPPGSSHEQRAAERTMLDLLGARRGIRLDPVRLTVPSGARVEIDGADPDRHVLVECWSHYGRPKAAQKHKLLADALKLTWIATTLDPPPELVLCLADRLAAGPFLPSARSWSAQALTDLGISIEIVNLPPDVRAGVEAAQKRQYR